MIIIQILILFITFIVFPFILGFTFEYLNEESSVIFDFITGFFVMFVLFGIISIPLGFINATFNLISIIYSIALLIICLILIKLQGGKIKENVMNSIKQWKKWSKWDLIYLVIFLIILCFQVYKMITSDLSYNAADDATYVVYASSALSDNHIFMTAPYGGGAVVEPPAQRIFQIINIYPAYFCKLTGINVTTMCHTIFASALLLYAYGAIYLLGQFLLKKKDDRLIFMIFVSLIYIFGSYSHYSTSFRMLGVIWQGKAILAVLLFPYLLSYYSRIMKLDFKWKNAGFLVMLSGAAVFLTMGGILTIVAVTGGLTLFSFFNKETRKFTNFYYLIVTNLLPLLVAIFYLISSEKISF